MSHNLILDESGNQIMEFDGSGPHTKVGIFWSVVGSIVADAVYLYEAEPYGDALQHGGHYEFWQKLKPFTDIERIFKGHAYDYYPRGRVLFFPKRQVVRVYVDNCMDSDIIDAALDLFEFQELNIEIETDLHYRCSDCNRMFVDDPV